MLVATPTYIVGLDHRSVITEVVRRVKATSFLEVGVADGDSTLAAVRGGAKKLTLCDTWGSESGGTGRGSHDHVLERLADAAFVGEVNTLDGPSHDTLQLLAGQQFDVTHVDADHSYDGALGDLSLVWPLTSRVMAVHDIFMPEVWRALDTWRATAVHEVRHAELSLIDHGTILVLRETLVKHG